MRYFYFFFLWINLTVYGQYNYSSNTAHISILNAIHLNNDIIEERLEHFEKKVNSKPLMFVNVKRKVSDLNRASNYLSQLINSIQKEVGSERILYELIADDFYEKVLFTNSGKLTERGNQLKVALNALYLIGNKINVHGLTGLSDFLNLHFNTKEVYYDAQENKIDYFENLFYDKSNYGIMMTLHYLLLDVKVFQLLYYRSVMSY